MNNKLTTTYSTNWVDLYLKTKPVYLQQPSKQKNKTQTQNASTDDTIAWPVQQTTNRYL